MRRNVVLSVAVWLMGIVSAAGSSLSSLPSAEFDCGGAIFDMEKISARLYGEDGQTVRDYRPLLSVCHGMGSNVWAQALEAFPIIVTSRPMNFLDRRFAVSRGQCGIVQFGWKRRKEYRIANCADLTFELKVPCGYRMLGTTFGDIPTTKAERQEDGSTRMSVRLMEGLRPGEFMSSYRTLGVLIEPMGDAPEGKLALRVVGTADGKALSPWETITLYTVAPVRAKAVPRRFLNGLDTSIQHGFRSAEAYRPLAKLWHDIGVRVVVQEYGANDFIPHWKAYRDHKLVVNFVERLRDNYQVCNSPNRPKADCFVYDRENPRVKGRWIEPIVAQSTCPMAIYEERPYFLNTIMPELVGYLKGADGVWANWEGSWYRRLGCFCDSCRREFATYAKLPQEEVDATWPRGFEKGEKWEEVGRAFRSWQHGKMMKTLNRHISRALGEGSMGFIPGVSWVEMSERWPTKDDSPEAKAVDYADEFKWMNPWGPYAYWFTLKPYRYRKYVSLVTWYVAKDVRRRADLDYRDGHRPKLMAYPNGFQCGSYLATPEQLQLAMEDFLVNGWEACCPYFFPNGCDARYLRAYANAVELSARIEDFTLDGRRADGLVTATPTAEYAVPTVRATAWLEASTNVSPLQTAAYDLKGSRLVAALNHWPKAPAFFTLRNRGLVAGDYSVTAGDVVYAKDAARLHWTAEELADGIFLGVGAMRTVALEIRPRAEKAAAKAKRVMTTAALRNEYERLKPSLEVAAEDDRAYRRTEPSEPWSSRYN